MSHIHDTYKTFYLKEWNQNFLELHLEVVEAKMIAIEDGWVHLAAHLISTHDPYDDIGGDPELSIRGMRLMTEEEKLEVSSRETVNQYALDKDISVYDASVVLRLKKEGKIV